MRILILLSAGMEKRLCFGRDGEILSGRYSCRWRIILIGIVAVNYQYEQQNNRSSIVMVVQEYANFIREFVLSGIGIVTLAIVAIATVAALITSRE